MKAVILAGGIGSRISEETTAKPKPMIEIGGRPVLWHIMKIYSAHGIHDFVVCLGYKGYVIKEYFANYFLHMSDVTFDIASNRMEVHQNNAEPWRITLVDTGEDTMTGGRLRRVREYITDDTFCFTYGDGVSNVNIAASIQFHETHGKLATMTAVQPPGRFGAIRLNGDEITGFQEKPEGEGGWINGGFFVLSRRTIDYIEDDSTSWEIGPLEQLAKEKNLGAFLHRGFWQPMDTMRDKNQLEALWALRESTMESVEVNPNFWKGKRIFLTGHTGFKGGWLSLWLQSLGAEVHGFALNPPTEPNLFLVARIAEGMASSEIGDIRDSSKLTYAMQIARPEIVLHLAAQPLVHYSYMHPAETYAVNVMGTVHVLEAVRATPGVKAVLNVTTDKCYENREWVWGYRENEAMGGYDPYSSSKGCAELVTAAYRRSFLESAGIALASARAGNVIGGGDWADHRLVPDILRALDAGETLKIRSPQSIRPWQHVLEPLSGYLMLAERLCAEGADFAGAWNFGPAEEDARSVQWIVECLAEMRNDVMWQCDETPQPHEAHYLKLDSSKARNQLNWQPRSRLQDALRKTLDWHEAWHKAEDMHAVTLKQIAHYRSTLQSN